MPIHDWSRVPDEATWNACPEDLRVAVETGVIPEPDAE
jgi:hypothetical protein